MKRKICIITGACAEYGLLYWLMKEIQEDGELQLQIIATGMHLSPEFGLTYRQIEQIKTVELKGVPNFSLAGEHGKDFKDKWAGCKRLQK